MALPTVILSQRQWLFEIPFHLFGDGDIPGADHAIGQQVVVSEDIVQPGEFPIQFQRPGPPRQPAGAPGRADPSESALLSTLPIRADTCRPGSDAPHPG